MGVITTGSFAKALYPGVSAWWGQAYKENDPQWPALFTQFSSGRAYEEDVGTTGFGLAVIKDEGGGISYDSQRQGYIKRYQHVTYGLGFIITKEMFEDDLYDVAARNRARALAFSLNQTKEIVAANIFNRAFSSSYTGADGKELCATDHPNLTGGTWANEIAIAADLSEASLEQACIDINKFTNDNGMSIAIRPSRLLIPVDLEYEATRILRSNLQSGVANNDINALRVLGRIPQIVVNNYLTDTDAWFILTDAPDGLKHFTREADTFSTDDDFDTENAKFKAKFRGSWGWTDARAVYGSTGA